MKGEKSMKWLLAALYAVCTAICGAYTAILVVDIVDDHKKNKEEEEQF